MAALTTPKIRVILQGAGDELTEHQFQALNVDMLAWDRDRPRYGWPQADVAPMLWVTYIAWKACKRLNILDVPLKEFETTALQVEVIKPADEPGADQVDPTQTAAAAE